MKRLLIRLFGALALNVLVCGPAAAHHITDPLQAAALVPAPGAADEQLTGIVHRLTIDDRVVGSVIELYSVELDDGSAVPIKGAVASGLEPGARVEVSGRRNGKTLFVSGVRQLAPRQAGASAAWKANPLVQLEGTLALLHADHFAEARSDFIFEVHDASGAATTLRFHVVPEALHAKMKVVVSGRVAADGAGIEPESVTVVGLPPPQTSLQTNPAKAPTTNNVLVILMTFTDSPAVPFTQAQVQTVFAGGTGSVAAYFDEVSFGQQLLNPTVTSWLSTNAATPASCDWQKMGTLGRTAASAAGYNTASYQNLVYVFPRVGACGWAGLAYIGASGVWINGYNSTSVYGHELGHNFGLLHAGSLGCGGVVIGGACGVSEYGDPFGIMGNQSAMHFNAAQKLDLGWIGTGTVITHGAGSGTYVLNPVETGGGGVYAVRIPAAANPNRTYWLEYRQPIGFDAGLANYPNNGAQVRVASPFETLCSGCDAWSNDTQLLDMTPGTTTFTDAALVVGKSFADTAYGINISVISATASGLTVQVSAPGSVSATSTTLRSSVNPAVAGASVTFTATVTGVAPTGNVAFAADGATITGCGGVALGVSGNVGTAACSTSSLAAGTHSVIATYAGNAGNAGSASTALSQVINPPPLTVTATSLATSANPGLVGANVTFTASVTGSAPTGSVSFKDGGSTLAGCAAVTLAGSGNTRTAECSTSALTGGNHSVVASYGGDTANAGSASAPLSQGMDAPAPGVVWVEDAVPAGAVTAGNGEGWNWISTNPAPFSGGLAHQSALAAGLHQHYFYGTSAPLAVGANDTLYAYVYLDPANPPSEVMLQWLDGSSWEHRAYWGANAIGLGSDGTASRRYMGALPAGGQWVRLAVPAAAVGLDGKTLTGMAFTLYNGRATWDRAGTEVGTPGAGWVDEALPAGVVPAGNGEGWNWTSTNPTPFAGALAHQSALAAGLHQHYFHGAAAPLAVGANDTLYAYVYLDPANPPSAVMLQWLDGSSWEHRAYWGANVIGLGTGGTASRRYMGALPAAGQWVRLAVPAAAVGLNGKTLTGMAFTLYNGRATWDRAGTEAGTSPSAVWVDDALPAGAVPAGNGEGWNWISTNPAPFSGGLAHQSALAAGLHQHYFERVASPLWVGTGDTLYAYVYLDPANPPSEVMLQWLDGSSWEHRAYWGANAIGLGSDGTASRRYMGPLPAAGQWVRIAVPAAAVGLEGTMLTGMAFTLYNGRATWDSAGK